MTFNSPTLAGCLILSIVIQAATERCLASQPSLTDSRSLTLAISTRIEHLGVHRDEISNARRGHSSDRFEVMREPVISVIRVKLSHRQQVVEYMAPATREPRGLALATPP